MINKICVVGLGYVGLPLAIEFSKIFETVGFDINKDKVIELKCPKEDTYGVPDKWKFQMEFYHRATGKDVRLGIFYKNDSELIRFFPYEPSNETWELIQNTIKEFHLKLQKKYGK